MRRPMCISSFSQRSVVCSAAVGRAQQHLRRRRHWATPRTLPRSSRIRSSDLVSVPFQFNSVARTQMRTVAFFRVATM